MIRHLYLACMIPVSIALLSCGESTPQPQKGKYGYLPSPTPKSAAAPTPTPIPIPVPTPTPGPEVNNIPNPAGTPTAPENYPYATKVRVNPVVFTALMRQTQGKSTSRDILLELK